ncbi:hypothetical protein HJG60_009019 [Phyllostomus discolor]|uniref:Uncharacterized protein n=1 Tax=Phyllostomus discolor TaxID=89673 RepID=A0A833YF44_9CHIR|nr:hypothetical protein HJG60_009019 [Phyllostomus discolor]
MTPPHIQCHKVAKWAVLTRSTPKAGIRLSYNIPGAPSMGIKAALPNMQKHREVAKMKKQTDKAQMKEVIKTPQRELSDTETANLSDAQFKVLVIRMLTEMIQGSHKTKKEVKAIQREIKKNIQGTNSEQKEAGIRINNLEPKEEINIQPEQTNKNSKK